MRARTPRGIKVICSHHGDAGDLMRNSAVALVAAIAVVELSACGSPTLRYRVSADPNADAANLESGALLFQLRTTNLTLLTQQQAGVGPMGQSGPPPEDACKGDDKHSAASPSDCLGNVKVAATAASQGRYYVASNGNWFLRHTRLSAATADGDDGFVTSVDVTYSDATGDVAAAAGAGAAAGFVFGPWGAVAGGVLSGGAALVGNLSQNQLLAYRTGRTERPHPFEDEICPADKTDAAGHPVSILKPAARALVLPVNITLTPEDGLTTTPGCWHVLGVNPAASLPAGAPAAGGDGWLYRIVMEDPAPLGSMPVDSYFKEDERGDFPITPCQKADLQIVWWEDLNRALTEEPGANAVKARIFSLTVANPALVRRVPLPKAGGIKLGTLCGASVSASAYSGGTLASGVADAIKAASNVKDAQDKWKQSKK